MTPRQAVFAAFIAFGAGFGTWAGSIATVAAKAGMTPQLIGFAITAFIAASLTGMAAGGALARTWPVKRLLLTSILAAALVLALLLHASDPVSFAAGVFVFGLVKGVFDGQMNAEGTAVEADLGHPVLAGFHASASFAAAATAILSGFVAFHWGTTAAALIGCTAYLAAFGLVWSAMPLREVEGARDAAPAAQPWRFNGALLFLGLIVGIAIAGEMAAAMFSAPALAAQAPELAAYAGFGATAFALCQGAVRCAADTLRRKFGDLRVIEASVLASAAGFAVVATSTSFAQSALGFALIGAGTGCVVPCGFSMAPRYAGLAAAQALGLLALVTALPRIPAPLAFGEIAERFAYPAAFALNGLLFAAAFVLASRLRRRQTPPAALPRPAV